MTKLIVLLLCAFAVGQESRPQMSVRVADEEAAAAQKTVKPKHPAISPARKQTAQAWPKPPRKSSLKKQKKTESGGWSGKS